MYRGFFHFVHNISSFQKCGGKSGKPTEKVVISNCGELVWFKQMYLPFWGEKKKILLGTSTAVHVSTLMKIIIQ